MTVKFYSRIRICQNQEKFVQNCHALAGVVRNLCDANKGANGYPLGAPLTPPSSKFCAKSPKQMDINWHP